MSHELIILHCAPTLAGIKVGSLFSCQYDSKMELYRDVAERNRFFRHKGLYFQILRYVNGNALIYVFRLNQILAHLQKSEVQQFLGEQGYTDFSLSGCLKLLKSHLMEKDFPHEIGVFLGYPIGDIRGFMEHRGANCKCTGCWKVYTDEQYAQQVFARYKRCTSVYYQRYISGTDITQLVIAG